ncbi:hypothetical protein ABFS82_14G231100 [Erythranthe guttata]|uniref:F-box domain-containing protein n=1 Tax=Erythranthe guttata TaxID=4155 RepID=A0A022R8J3_ERYGU|nr:PREDICTED: F-box protein At2g27310-like [Erythranthe guttata]EYU36048.1 hypothetical protein MIMGU_mgv1a009467mg [Erythranthe guttata]|eukprot:XP_012838520.1 PREDICTED: F-box protein At2g27310-like [Erythranthe guttata]
MCSTAAVVSAAADKGGGGTPITDIHTDVIRTHILNRLDGPTLAAASCASQQLLSLCNEDHLWKDICNSTWPSTTNPAVGDAISAFPSGHRSFYSDSFSCLARQPSGKAGAYGGQAPETAELISAVDIYYDGELVYSKVVGTETLSLWYLGSPFRIDLMEPKETVATPLMFDGDDGACMGLAEERLRVSWILIDPSKGRAVNVASLKAVEARRHWLTEDIHLRFATVVDGGGDGEAVQFAVVVTCGGKEGRELQVREVSMQAEDLEGKILTGLDTLEILDAAMVGPRRRCDGETEKEMYRKFLRMKVQSRERNQKREKSLDMVFITAGVSILLAIWMFFLSR